MGDDEAVDIGGGRGVLVQHKESTDFRSPQVGISVNSEFTQQDGRKKKTAERSCVTNVTRLFLTCFVVIFT